MDFSSLLNVGAQGLTAYKKGQAQRKFQDLMLGEKEQAAELDRRMKEAQIAEAQARAEALLHPPAKPVAERPPHYVTNEEGQFAVGEGNVAQPIVGPDGKPLKGSRAPQEPSQYTFPTGTDANGNAIVLRGNNRTGVLERTDIGRPESGGGGAIDEARLQTARNQAAEADKIMRAFEDKVLSGERQIDATSVAAAKLALKGGALTSTGAETALNKMDADLANYVRAAKQLATAERLITPRGGSNYLMAAEAMLAAAGAHAGPAQIEQARKYREALIKGVNAHGGSEASSAAPSSGGRTVIVNGKTFRLPE